VGGRREPTHGGETAMDGALLCCIGATSRIRGFFPFGFAQGQNDKFFGLVGLLQLVDGFGGGVDGFGDFGGLFGGEVSSCHAS
jgi:hypothetical protein